MPAPKILSGLPKPLLFALYGAISGFLAALVIAEPLYTIISESEPIDRSAVKVIGHFLLLVAVWTAAIVTPISLAILAGQHHYLKGTFPPAEVVLAGLFGGIAVGVVGGMSGQVLFFFAPESFALNCLIRIFSWALLGGLSGMGLSLFIPNMKRLLGLAGGTLGGVVGCIGFIAASLVVGDTLGRLIGGTMLGFCIGLMVVVAETMFRRAWLEVRFGARETITITLGPEPVKIGGDAKMCTVWARGAAPVALRFFVRNGQVICDDRTSKGETIAENGYSLEIGNVTVTVRMDGGGSKSKMTHRQRRPVARPVPEPPVLSLDDDDGFNMPVPISANPPPLPLYVPPSPPTLRPIPVTTPVPPTPPTTQVPKEPVLAKPPPVPIPSASPLPPDTPKTKDVKDPDACPSCGRKNPGRRGARYCVVCDQMY